LKGVFRVLGLKEDQVKGENYSFQQERGISVPGAVLKGYLRDTAALSHPCVHVSGNHVVNTNSLIPSARAKMNSNKNMQKFPGYKA
jgi:hypothetical protein